MSFPTLVLVILVVGAGLLEGTFASKSDALTSIEAAIMDGVHLGPGSTAEWDN